MVPRRGRADAMHRHGRPAYIAAITSSSYSWPRRFQLHGMFSPPIVARQGIVAGGFAASYQLNGLLLSAVREFAAAHPGRSCSIHVDDFGVDLVADTFALAALRLRGAACDLREAMRRCGLRFALPKQALLASSVEV